MTTVTIHQAKTTLSKLVAKVQAGHEIVVCRGRLPVAKLVPYQTASSKRPKVGELTSAPIQCQPGCFAPLSDEEMEAWGMA